MAKKIVRLTESEMNKLVRKIVTEQNAQTPAAPTQTQPTAPTPSKIQIKTLDELKNSLYPLFNDGKGRLKGPMKATIGLVGSSNFYISLSKDDGTTITLNI